MTVTAKRAKEIASGAPLKIAVWHNLPSGGAKRLLYYQVRGLTERGHSLECWTLTSADRAYMPLSEFASERVVNLNWQPYLPSGSLAKSLMLYPNSLGCKRAVVAAEKRCAREINSGSFDLAFVNSCRFFLVPSITLYLRRPRALHLGEPNRYLYEARPVLPWIGAVRGGSEPLRLYLRRALVQALLLPLLRLNARDEWRNAHACDLIFANSYFSCESISRAYGYNATLYYPGIDTQLFRDLGRNREPLIVGLSALDRAKGIELAIEAVSRLPAPRPRLLWIANSGEAAYMGELQALAAAANVDLELKLRLPDAEVVENLNRAAVMLYTARLEPFGMAPLEANACGTPVVAVAEGGVRETIKDNYNGFLVERSPQPVATALTRLLLNPPLARLLGEQGSKYVREQWSIERSVDRLEGHLRRLAMGKHSFASAVGL